MKKLTTLFLCALVCLGLISCTTVLEAGSTYHFSISGVSDTDVYKRQALPSLKFNLLGSNYTTFLFSGQSGTSTGFLSVA